MKKCKIIVYAIAKNESSFVNRWVDSMQEADDIYVLDTGSTDATVELLLKRNVHVKSLNIEPWRFDVARNESLKLIPHDADICVCVDLDEVFEKGWRLKLENSWVDDVNVRYRYTYHWKLNEKNMPLVSYRQDKIHSFKNYSWVHPVHEVLKADGLEKYVDTDIVVYHYPDVSKSRSSYLPLLELGVREEPDDDRNIHYLGREYMFYQMYDKAIMMFHRHLACKNAVWSLERCASMRFLGRCYFQKNCLEEALLWYKKAIEEEPNQREGYVELANYYYLVKDYKLALKYIRKALKIKEKSNSYINEEFAWNDYVYDLASIIYYHNGYLSKAIYFIKKALKFNPDEERYQQNLRLLDYQLAISHE